MLAELHCHSIYSRGRKVPVEGVNTPKEIIEYAKKIGLDCIAITDHNTICDISEAKKVAKKVEIVFIPGEEISTADGHVIGLGIQEPIKPKLSIEETVDKIHEQGGIAIAAHPFDCQRKGPGEKALKCDVIEIFNAMNVERIANWKAKKFASKFKKPGVTGSDAHFLPMIGTSMTHIRTDGDIDDILHAIKNNNVKTIERYMPIGVITEWGVTRLKLSYSDVVNYIESHYNYPKRILSKQLLQLVKKSPGKIDYLFRFLTYIGLCCAVSYSAFRTVFRIPKF